MDAGHMMVDPNVCDGPLVAAEIIRQFEDDRVLHIHIHNAKCGCFSCPVDR